MMASNSSVPQRANSHPDEVVMRLMDLDLNKAPTIEKSVKSSSETRPLKVEEEDLDLDLELDDNIDTSVSFNKP